MSMPNKVQLSRQSKTLVRYMKQSMSGNVKAYISNIYLSLLCRLNHYKIHAIIQSHGGSGRKAQEAVIIAVSNERKHFYD